MRQSAIQKPAPLPEIISSQFDTWRETAGLIENLDAVVTVDTSILHLAVGMRKPAFILVSGMCNWRLAHGDKFCPGAKTYRNTGFGFDEAVEALIAELRKEFPNQAGSPKAPRILGTPLVQLSDEPEVCWNHLGKG